MGCQKKNVACGNNSQRSNFFPQRQVFGFVFEKVSAQCAQDEPGHALHEGQEAKTPEKHVAARSQAPDRNKIMATELLESANVKTEKRT